MDELSNISGHLGTRAYLILNLCVLLRKAFKINLLVAVKV